MATSPPYQTLEELNARFSEHVSRGKVELYRKFGVELVMGERSGVRFRDAFTQAWFYNCHCNGGVFNLGHRHPVVLEALGRALASLDIGNHHLVSSWRTHLAERLVRLAGAKLAGVVFGVSGGEAVDLALKLARGVTGRSKIVSVSGGYHGHTGLALAAGDAQYRDPFGIQLQGFVQVPFNDLASLEAAFDADTAALIVEPIPATLGMPLPAPGYLEGAQELCRKRGVKLVIDEVQTGLGRTGNAFYFQTLGLEPDALIVGKGLSGGVYPITATLLARDMLGFFDDKPFVHISTFGGAELGCVVALAVLDLLEEDGFLARVRELSQRFARGLSGLPFEVRRAGLMMGLAFEAEAGGMLAAKLFYDHGVFATYANNDKRVLQFLPPLITSDAEADEILARVRRAFGA